MTQGGIGLALHDKDLVDVDTGAQCFDDRVAALDDAIVFGLHRGGAAQRLLIHIMDSSHRFSYKVKSKYSTKRLRGEE